MRNVQSQESKIRNKCKHFANCYLKKQANKPEGANCLFSLFITEFSGSSFIGHMEFCMYSGSFYPNLNGNERKARDVTSILIYLMSKDKVLFNI